MTIAADNVEISPMPLDWREMDREDPERPAVDVKVELPPVPANLVNGNGPVPAAVTEKLAFVPTAATWLEG